MSSDLEKKDTTWTHEPPAEPGWYWMRRLGWSQGPKRNWDEPEVVLLRHYGGGIALNNSVLEKTDYYQFCPTPILPPSHANAPAPATSEPDASPECSHQKEIRPEDVKQAFKEAWHKGKGIGYNRKWDEVFEEVWNESDTKLQLERAKLEGGKE